MRLTATRHWPSAKGFCLGKRPIRYRRLRSPGHEELEVPFSMSSRLYRMESMAVILSLIRGLQDVDCYSIPET